MPKTSAVLFDQHAECRSVGCHIINGDAVCATRQAKEEIAELEVAAHE